MSNQPGTGPEITWISRGRAGCRGNVLILEEQGGRIRRHTCDSCSLNWTMTVSA